MYQQLKERGYAAPVDMLMDLELLSKKDYELWRNGKIPYLEKSCNINLKKLSMILHEMRVYAKKSNLKPSYTVYKQVGGEEKKWARRNSCYKIEI